MAVGDRINPPPDVGTYVVPGLPATNGTPVAAPALAAAAAAAPLATTNGIGRGG